MNDRAPLSTNQWNMRTEAAKADSIQGRIFGDVKMVNAVTIPDAYGHISNYDALINFGSDFLKLDKEPPPENSSMSMWGDLSQLDIAMFTSGRGHDELDMEFTYYGNTNEYDRHGFAVREGLRDNIHAQGLMEGHPNVSSELVHPKSTIDNRDDNPPPITPPNGAFGSTDSISMDINSLQQSRIKVSTHAQTGIDNVRLADTKGLDSIAAPYYGAEQRTLEMQRTLFVRDAYMQ
jgi:hypothetical protein